MASFIKQMHITEAWLSMRMSFIDLEKKLKSKYHLGQKILQNLYIQTTEEKNLISKEKTKIFKISIKLKAENTT